MVGELVVLHNCQTSGYKDGTYGIIVKFEVLGPLYSIYWVLLPDDAEVPMWDSEFEVVNESWRSNNNS
jgi:hypothetical protein